MRLGNTGGNNLGKKYIKLKGDEVITDVNQKKADAFNEWFSNNYESLRKKILAQESQFDDEVFHETYIRITTKILYGGLEIKDYASYFHRSYFTNKIQLATKENRFVELNTEYIQQIDESDENIEIMKKQEENIQKIKDFVKAHYPNDYDLFISNMMDGVTYSKLSDQTGIKENIIQNKVSTIKKALKKEFENISLPNKNRYTAKTNQIAFKQSKEYVSQAELIPKAATSKNLSDFSAIDLMKELYARGYTGTLSYTQIVDISKINTQTV